MSKGNILFFLAGTVIGGILGWTYAKEKYAAIAEEEIRSVRETFRAREAERNKPAAETPTGDEIAEYDKKLQEAGYTGYSTVSDVSSLLPEVVSPDEFYDNEEEYTVVELLYFADGVLADEVNEIVQNADEIVGDAPDHFGEYEDDSVYVRNDTRRCYYAIRRDLRKYTDVLKEMPPVH